MDHLEGASAPAALVWYPAIGGRSQLSSVFISYRRGEAASAVAGRLFDRLVTEFSRPQVFMDVDTIEPGADFVEAIEQAVGSCEVLLAIIDPAWLHAADAKGTRRLDDPNDYGRIEVSEGLRGDARVVPVLVGGAAMPKADELPSDLGALASHNAVTLTHERWRTDIEPLLTVLGRELGTNRDRVIEAVERQGVGVAGEAVDANASATTTSNGKMEPWVAVVTESSPHSRTVTFRLSRDIHSLKIWHPPVRLIKFDQPSATLDGQKIKLRRMWGPSWMSSTFPVSDGPDVVNGGLLFRVSRLSHRINALHIEVGGRRVYAEGDNPPDHLLQRIVTM